MITGLEYASIFWLMFLLPSEAVMPSVGFAVANGEIEFLPALLAGFAGTVSWSVALYWLFRLLRKATTDSFVQRRGKWIGLSPKKVKRAGQWFDRHAKVTVFASRFVPALRSAVCIPAGLARMPFGLFLLYASLGSALDSTLLTIMGYTAGSHFETVQLIMDGFVAWSIPIALCALGIWLIWYEVRKSRG